jgi:uncharacterized protein YegL
MTNDDLTLLAVLVDRSGSMSSCRTDMEGGLNTLVEEQRNLPGTLDLAIAQFDTVFDVVRPMGRLDVAYRYELVPRGATALLDAMGKYITDIGGQLASKSDDERPAKVVMVIVTDGLENSSKEWGRDAVKELVTKQRDQWAWEFIFLGANMDAVAEGASLGVSTASSMTFDANDPVAVAGSYAAVSSNLSGYRSGLVNSTAFSEEDRDKAMGKTKAKS